MAQPFGHEKLIVYQKGMRFVAMRSALLEAKNAGRRWRASTWQSLPGGLHQCRQTPLHACLAWRP